MKQLFQRLLLSIGLIVFGFGIAGIPSSGIANYNIEILYVSVINLVVGAVIIASVFPFYSLTKTGE